MTAGNPLHLWFDGHLHAKDDAILPPLEHALHYGSGVFEGIRAYSTDDGPAIFRLAEHMDRMEAGAAMLGMELDRRAMEDAMGQLLYANGLDDAYIRPIAFYGGGSLTLDVDHLTLRQCVATLPWTSHLGDDAAAQGIRLKTSSFIRNGRKSIAPLKLTGGYVNSIMAKREAVMAGFDEALFLDGDRVCECTGENVFLIKDGRFTAVDHPDALPGITRATLIELTGADSRAVSIAELLDADEVFVCGTSAEVTPVTRIDLRRWEAGPRTLELRRAYLDIVHGRDRSYDRWLTRPLGNLAAK